MLFFTLEITSEAVAVVGELENTLMIEVWRYFMHCFMLGDTSVRHVAAVYYIHIVTSGLLENTPLVKFIPITVIALIVMQTRRKGQFCFVLTLSPGLCAFLNKIVLDRRLDYNNSFQH